VGQVEGEVVLAQAVRVEQVRQPVEGAAAAAGPWKQWLMGDQLPQAPLLSWQLQELQQQVLLVRLLLLE
jgi:hypothetical protein